MKVIRLLLFVSTLCIMIYDYYVGNTNGMILMGFTAVLTKMDMLNEEA